MNAPDFLRPAVGRTGFKEWTMPEVALLREIYPTQGPQGVMQRLPHRTYSAITGQAADCRFNPLSLQPRTGAHP